MTYLSTININAAILHIEFYEGPVFPQNFAQSLHASEKDWINDDSRGNKFVDTKWKKEK